MFTSLIIHFIEIVLLIFLQLFNSFVFDLFVRYFDLLTVNVRADKPLVIAFKASFIVQYSGMMQNDFNILKRQAVEFVICWIIDWFFVVVVYIVGIISINYYTFLY